jgi:hypothetical protein
LVTGVRNAAVFLGYPALLKKTETLLARVKRGPASDVVIAGTANDARGALRGTSSAAAAPLS